MSAMLCLKRRLISVGLAVATALALPLAVPQGAQAHAPSGAIFTTLADGREVNLNIFPTKESVYLDGGPGPGAPQTAAGLDDGTYVFQVTNPNGATLLSTDRARCRQFTVTGGVIAAVVDPDGEHVTGADVDHPPAKTVQLVPFNLTPNPGGVFKVWVTRLEDFLLGCQALGKSGTSGLDLVDCGDAPANHHGFIPSHSKTDNFKVKDELIREIDVVFFDDANGNGVYDWYVETQLSGRTMTWVDTHGIKNPKHSYFLPRWNITEAHAEAVEPGIHYVEIQHQPGCTVGDIMVDNVWLGEGPRVAKVDLSNVKNSDKDVSVIFWVACKR
jgi:hypothetical protein